MFYVWYATMVREVVFWLIRLLWWIYLRQIMRDAISILLIIVLLPIYSWVLFYLSASFLETSGFEAGGPNVPSNIDPWSIIGDESKVIVSTDRSSCFDRNKIAVQVQVLCDHTGANICPDGGVGIYNPGFWGMVCCSLMLDRTFFMCFLLPLSRIHLSIFRNTKSTLDFLHLFF